MIMKMIEEEAKASVKNLLYQSTAILNMSVGLSGFVSTMIMSCSVPCIYIE